MDIPEPPVPAGLADVRALIDLAENKDKLKTAVAELTLASERAEKAAKDARATLKAAGEEIAKAETMKADAAVKMEKANRAMEEQGRVKGQLQGERARFETERREGFDALFQREASCKARENQLNQDIAEHKRQVAAFTQTRAA